MSKIHMETENVRNLARLLNNQASEIESNVDQLRKSANRLSMGWQGGSRSDRFISTFKNFTRALETKAQDMHTLSVRVNNEVDQWIEVDTSFGKDSGFWNRYIDNLRGFSKDDLVSLGATAGVISLLKPGSMYAGEVIIRGSRDMKAAAGLSPYLTHIRADHVPNHLLKGALKKFTPLEAGMAGIEFGGKAIEDWNKYDRGSERAAAIGIDAAFVAGKAVGIHYAGWAASVAAGAALVFLVPAAPAIAVAAVGLGAWWAVSHFGGKALDTVFETYKDPLVKGGARLIDQAGYGIHNTANFVADTAQQAARQVDRGFKELISKITSVFD